MNFTSRMRIHHAQIKLSITFRHTLSVLIAANLIGAEVLAAYIGTWMMKPSDVVSISGSGSMMGYITSPNYPNGAPINIVAIATLHAKNSLSEIIKLSFDELRLQTANNCEGESLNIFLVHPNDNALDPEKLTYTVCGAQPVEPLIVYSSTIAIQYVRDEFSDRDDSGNRFRIKFEFLDKLTQPQSGCDRSEEFMCQNRRCISNQLLCNKLDDCGDGSDEDLWTPCDNLPTIPYSIDYECGLSSFGNSLISPPNEMVQIRDRIVGGSRAQRETSRLPQVSIQNLWIEPMSHTCGGTLIHPMFVLTSAHCFKNEYAASNYKLIFGMQHLTANNASGIQIRYISHISFYPNSIHSLPRWFFSDHDKANNMAVIELNAPVLMTSHVWPACLPHLGETIEAGRECVVTGFGETRGSGDAFSLKKVKQTIQLGSLCNSTLDKFDNDDHTMICVENELAQGPCQGDSGGPLLCRDDVAREDRHSIFESRQVNVTQPESWPAQESRGEPGELIRFLTLVLGRDNHNGLDKSARPGRSDSKQTRYTVHGITSFTTAGNMGGGYCGLKGAPTIYGRVSTRIEWILSVLKLALQRLNREDQLQDVNQKKRYFGYMFRSGYSQHDEFTRPMTINPVT